MQVWLTQCRWEFSVKYKLGLQIKLIIVQKMNSALFVKKKKKSSYLPALVFRHISQFCSGPTPMLPELPDEKGIRKTSD